MDDGVIHVTFVVLFIFAMGATVIGSIALGGKCFEVLLDQDKPVRAFIAMVLPFVFWGTVAIMGLRHCVAWEREHSRESTEEVRHGF